MAEEVDSPKDGTDEVTETEEGVTDAADEGASPEETPPENEAEAKLANLEKRVTDTERALKERQDELRQAAEELKVLQARRDVYQKPPEPDPQAGQKEWESLRETFIDEPEKG